MARITSYPQNYDEYIGAEVVQLWHYGRTSGVFSADDNLEVTSAGGMDISVSAGAAWIRFNQFGSVVCGNLTPLSFSLDMADGVLSRIDRVVCRQDNVQNIAEIVVKKGTNGSTPVAPAITRNAEYWELVLADIYVGAGVMSVNQGNITDQRLNDNVCGLVRDGVEGIPSQSLYDQWQSVFTQRQQEFMTWFEGLQDILDENIASNLLNLIGVAQTAADNAQDTATTAQSAAALAQTTANERKPSSLTLNTSTTWSGSSAPFTQVLTVTGLTATDYVMQTLASTATLAQVEAYGEGNIRGTAQGTNSLTLSAFGDKPTIALPILVTWWRA